MLNGLGQLAVIFLGLALLYPGRAESSACDSRWGAWFAALSQGWKSRFWTKWRFLRNWPKKKRQAKGRFSPASSLASTHL